MFESFGAVLLPFLAALLHPWQGRFVQSGTRAGVSLSVMAGVANVVTAIIFFIYLKPDWSEGRSALDAFAAFNGVLFFFGQWWSIRSVQVGDIAVHSSALGVKILIVASLALVVGLEANRPYLIPASLLACVAVFLTAGGNLSGWREHKATVGFTVIACLFFGVNDFFTGWKAQDLGAGRWLTLMMATSGLISLGLLTRRMPQLRKIKWKGKPGLWVLGMSTTLAGQALLVNIAFSHFQQPTLSNVAYSTRGIIAVVFLWFMGERKRGSVLGKQLLGAILMIMALALALVTQA